MRFLELGSTPESDVVLDWSEAKVLAYRVITFPEGINTRMARPFCTESRFLFSALTSTDSPLCRSRMHIPIPVRDRSVQVLKVNLVSEVYLCLGPSF